MKPALREDVVRDPRYPVHRIADQLLPYLRVLVEQFHPQQVILFGSYAYGQPRADSDVDLLIITDVKETPLKEKIRIRNAWWNHPGRPPCCPSISSSLTRNGMASGLSTRQDSMTKSFAED